MSDTSKFWNRIADKYSRDPITDEAAYQFKLDATREFLHADTELIEIGCGTGSTAIKHAPFVKHILATDFSSRMLEIAKEKAEKAGVTNITFQQANIETDDLAEQRVDVILGMSVLHLLADKEAALAKIHGLLKDDGYFVSSTVCVGEKMKFLKYVAPIARRLGLFPMLRVFTGAQLIESLKEENFEIMQQWQPAKGKAIFIIAQKVSG